MHMIPLDRHEILKVLMYLWCPLLRGCSGVVMCGAHGTFYSPTPLVHPTIPPCKQQQNAWLDLQTCEGMSYETQKKKNSPSGGERGDTFEGPPPSFLQVKVF